MRNGWQNGSTIAIGNSGGDGRQWRRWATAGITMGDSNSGGMILMAINGGGAIDGPNGWQDGSNSAMTIAMNGGGSKEGCGNCNKGGGQATATAAKRAMATAMRVAGNEESNGDGGKSNGNGVEGSRRWQW
jgi:hypothetical protein